MLVIAFDIDEGEHKGYYQRLFDNNVKSSTPDKPAKWSGVYRQMLEGNKAAGFLKGIMTVLENSNTGFKWNWNEKKLKGLRFGGLFGREEYTNAMGETKMNTKIRFIRSVQTIEDGKYEIPADKLLPKQNSMFNEFDVNISSSDDDLPF